VATLAVRAAALWTTFRAGVKVLRAVLRARAAGLLTAAAMRAGARRSCWGLRTIRLKKPMEKSSRKSKQGIIGRSAPPGASAVHESYVFWRMA
jgi:hypothetical protein